MVVAGEIPEIDEETGRQGTKLKGKAVAVEHYLFDTLWNSGDRKMPQGVVQEEPPKQDEKAEEPVEAGDQQIEEEEKKASELTDEKAEEEKQVEDEKVEVTEEGWNERVLEAFQRTLIEAVGPEDLPMEPSDFQKLMQEYHLSDGSQIELKKS